MTNSSAADLRFTSRLFEPMEPVTSRTIMISTFVIRSSAPPAEADWIVSIPRSFMKCVPTDTWVVALTLRKFSPSSTATPVRLPASPSRSK